MISARTTIVPSKMEAIARSSSCVPLELSGVVTVRLTSCAPLELSGVVTDEREVFEVNGGRVVGSVGGVKVPRNKPKIGMLPFACKLQYG